MSLVDKLLAAIAQQQPVVIVALLVILLLSLFLHLLTIARLGRLNKKYQRLLAGNPEGENLEGLLLTHLKNVQLALERVKNLELDCSKNAGELKRCVQKVGVIRFNAFPDTGSDLSFALALLDKQGDGVVLSSLYGRNESRIYAKPVQRGASTYHLTDEEKEAIKQALEEKP